MAFQQNLWHGVATTLTHKTPTKYLCCVECLIIVRNPFSIRRSRLSFFEIPSCYQRNLLCGNPIGGKHADHACPQPFLRAETHRGV